MTKKFIGYTGDDELPFKNGDRVTIPKGVTVYSPFTTLKEAPAMRSFKVTIHHIAPGQSVPDYDYERYYKTLYPNAPVREGKHGQKYYDTCNPRVVWAGAGGYWKEVDINDLIGEDNG